MSKITHQICIIGAGPVGLAFANCLALSPHIRSIAIIDRKLPKPLLQSYQIPNQRVYSVNGPTLNVLNKLGVLSRIRQYGTLANIEVMSKQSESFIEWQQKSARIIQNDELVQALYTNLQQTSVRNKIDFIEGDIQSFNNDIYSECEVKLKDRNIYSKLLVGSDGNRSKVKQLANIATYGWSYRQKAIACTLSVENISETNNHSAFQIYHDSNILGILPLWKNYASIVWSLQIPDYQHIMQLQESKFVSKLNQLIQQTNNLHSNKQSYRPINNFEKLINKRLAFPLSTLQADMYTKHRLALIGDAAHSIHPMAGLGVNSGIMDGVLLANNVILNKKTGNDVGQAISLSGYQTKSKAMNYANSIAMQSIKKAFEIDVGPLNYLRKNVLNLFQQSNLIKSTMKGLVQKNPVATVQKFQWQTA